MVRILDTRFTVYSIFCLSSRSQIMVFIFLGDKSLAVPSVDKRKLSEVSNIIASQMDSLINSMNDNDSLLLNSPCKCYKSIIDTIVSWVHLKFCVHIVV